MEGLNQKGQAAVTDALYFLLIVTGISIFLFSFANTYGNAVSSKITTNYNTTFSTDALKTILYSSVPRTHTNSLYDPPEQIEVDHLLAYIKEDYSDDTKLDFATKMVLAENIKGIMAPITSNFDYAFSISFPTGDEKKYVFIFLKVTDTRDGLASDERVHYFFCGEKAGEESNYDRLKDKFSALLISVGETSAVSSRLKLSEVDEDGIRAGKNAQVDLDIWNSSRISKDKSFEEFFVDDPDWKCIDVT